MTETTAAVRNADVDWGRFGSQQYFAHNYAEMRADDARIIRLVRDWFAISVPAGTLLDGVDVGSGSNLYPAFALLPHCDRITLYEYADSNVAWLDGQLADLDESWAPFALAASGFEWRQARIGLPKVARVQQGSVFDLPGRRWQVGTMAFVAESLTEDVAEFEDAVGRFHGALKPRAPFAAAFMEGSEGYSVGGVDFPAVSVGAAMVAGLFGRLGATDLAVHRVDIDPAPIRAGYCGYVVAVGRA